MWRTSFICLFFSQHLYAQRITAEDLGLDSDSGGGEVFFGILFIAAVFKIFTDDLDNLSAGEYFTSLFFLFFGMFCIGIRTSDVGIPFFLIFVGLIAVVRFLKNKKK